MRGKWILFFLCIFLLLSLGVLSALILSEVKEIPLTKQDIVDNCANLDVIDTSSCLRNYVETFYKYKVTNDNLHLSFDQLKEMGGDCKDYSELYNELGQKLGFYSNKYAFNINQSVGHSFAVLSSEEGYCIIDQLNVWCLGTKK